MKKISQSAIVIVENSGVGRHREEPVQWGHPLCQAVQGVVLRGRYDRYQGGGEECEYAM